MTGAAPVKVVELQGTPMATFPFSAPLSAIPVTCPPSGVSESVSSTGYGISGGGSAMEYRDHETRVVERTPEAATAL
jgi:hypothetical protein